MQQQNEQKDAYTKHNFKSIFICITIRSDNLIEKAKYKVIILYEIETRNS